MPNNKTAYDLKLEVAVNEVHLTLHHYLDSARYFRAYGIEEISHIDQDYPYVRHPTQTGKYICLPVQGFRDKHLTELRVSLVIVTIQNIKDVLKATPSNLTVFEFVDKLSLIRSVLIAAAAENIRLSNANHKRHVTFNQAVANSNHTEVPFSFIWKMTFFQSRATKTIDKAVAEVDKVTNQFTYRLGRVS